MPDTLREKAPWRMFPPSFPEFADMHMRRAVELTEAVRDVLARWTESDYGDDIMDKRMDALRVALWGPDKEE